jgi:hypothetical protein
MTKTEQISEIKRIIGEWGSTSCSELETESSPCIRTIGNGRNNISQLAETFCVDGVEAVTYQHDMEISWDNVDYEDLSEDIVDEIYHIIEQYEVSNLKTIKRCKN